MRIPSLMSFLMEIFSKGPFNYEQQLVLFSQWYLVNQANSYISKTGVPITLTERNGTVFKVTCFKLCGPVAHDIDQPYRPTQVVATIEHTEGTEPEPFSYNFVIRGLCDIEFKWGMPKHGSGLRREAISEKALTAIELSFNQASCDVVELLAKIKQPSPGKKLDPISYKLGVMNSFLAAVRVVSQEEGLSGLDDVVVMGLIDGTTKRDSSPSYGTFNEWQDSVNCRPHPPVEPTEEEKELFGKFANYLSNEV